MPAISIFWFVLTGIIFAIWAAQFFLSLFRISRVARARAEARGGMWPTIHEQLSAFHSFLTAPDYRVDRRRMQILTLLMFAAIAVHMTLIPHP